MLHPIHRIIQYVFPFILLTQFAIGQDADEKMMSKEAEKFEKTCQNDLKMALELFQKLENMTGPKTEASVLIPLNELWIKLDRIGNLANLYQAVHPDAQLREVAAKCEQEISKLYTQINLSRPIFDAVSAVDISNADKKMKRFVELVLQDFRLSGVDQPPEVLEKIRQIQEELVVIGQDFSKNIREDVRSITLDSPDELEGLPDDYIQNHQPGEDGKIIITTDYPDYIPYMSYAKSDSRRLELYKKYRRRGYPANQEILNKLLEKRYELAQILGYANYAQYVTKDKMIKNPRNAADFINKVVNVATERANKDYEELLKRLKKEMPEASKVEDWQKTYISELVKLEAYGLDSREIRQYFSYDRVRDGLIKLIEDLFAVKIKSIQDPAWHPSVEVYELWSDQKIIGRFYLDMHPRKDKYKHAMMSQVITGISGQQIPEAALVCNFPGGDESQGLMEHDQVETFFHEFGHLMHHLFAGDQPWIRISGLRTEWDFVETPSNLFEEWAWDAKILQKFAINEKGEPIPDEIVKKMNRARKFRLGLDTIQQMFYASISLNFYNSQPGSFAPLEMVKNLQKKITPFDYVDDTYMHLAFGHLDNYSAIYYTYMWSSVIAKDLYSVFQKEGLENQNVALRYRKTVLEPGGAKEASQLVKDFMGREFSFEAFAEWLNADSI